MKWISFGLIIFLACNCSSRHDFHLYKVYPKKLKENNVTIKSSIKSDIQKGKLILNLFIKNNSNQYIIINYFDAALLIDYYRPTLSIVKANYKTELAPGEDEKYELIFIPINSVELFKKMNFRGDMKRQYSLKLDFIKFIDDSLVYDNSILIRMKEDNYSDFIINRGENSKLTYLESKVKQTCI